MAKELAQSGSQSIEEDGTWKLIARYLGLPGQQPMEKELSFFDLKIRYLASRLYKDEKVEIIEQLVCS